MKRKQIKLSLYYNLNTGSCLEISGDYGIFALISDTDIKVRKYG